MPGKVKSYHYSYCASRVKKRNKLPVRIGEMFVIILDWAKPVFIGALIGVFSISVLSLTPSLFMQHSFERNGIQLLSDRALADNSAEIISQAQKRIAASELYRPDMKFKVYLCSQHWKYLLASRFSLNSKGIYIPFTDRIILDMQGIAGKKDLVQCVAHEVTHAMVRNQFGLRSLVMPEWVSEGYAEYIAKGKWSSREAVRELLQLQSGRADPDDYGQSWLLVTYALNSRRIPLDKLFLKPPATEVLALEIQTQSLDWLINDIFELKPLQKNGKV